MSFSLGSARPVRLWNPIFLRLCEVRLRLRYPCLMRVRVHYLGMLRDIAGRDHETVELAEGARLSNLFAELEQRFPKLQGFRNSLALALNLEYSNAAAKLHDNDEVALIPP